MQSIKNLHFYNSKTKIKSKSQISTKKSVKDILSYKKIFNFSFVAINIIR